MLSETRKQRNARSIGKLIKNAREDQGYSQKAFAVAIGLEYYTMVSQMELGYTSVPPSLWPIISDVLRLNRSGFAAVCLIEYQPALFSALFGDRSTDEAAKYLTLLHRGQLERHLNT